MASDVRRLTDEERARTRRWVAMLDKQRATLRDEVEQDVAQYRELSPEADARLRDGLVRSGWRMLQSRADKDAVLAWSDPPAPDFDRIWKRLVMQERLLRANNDSSAV